MAGLGTTSSGTTSSGVAQHALLTGGGSGGHVFPGLAVADELVRRGWAVSWAGGHRGIEKNLVERRGMEFDVVPTHPLVGQGLGGKVRAVLTLMGGALQGRSLVRRRDARVVLGTGGYVSAPAMLGARLAGRPTVLIEPNADAGVANRQLSRWCDVAVLAHPSTAKQVFCPSDVTGIPIRDAFFHLAATPPDDAPLRLLILGGSQGARDLNRSLPKALARVMDSLGTLEVCHQAGQAHIAATRNAYASLTGLPGLSVKVVPFLDDMPAAMERSHLILSRAGAITLAEICAAGRAALLAPLSLAGGHQRGNAQRLADLGAAEILAPEESHGEDASLEITRILTELLGDRERLTAMGQAARAAARPGAAVAIADHVERLAGLATGGNV